MAATLIYIGKSVEVGSGSSPLRGLENRRPKGYAGSSPVPSAISNQQLIACNTAETVTELSFLLTSLRYIPLLLLEGIWLMQLLAGR